MLATGTTELLKRYPLMPPAWIVLPGSSVKSGAAQEIKIKEEL
jgi:hypothetical protein